ncbi:putative DNA binding domain-containing protein [Lachnospiraceae bacterium ZAX-1]
MDVEALIKRYEVERVEFKQELPDKSIKYIKSVVGYANTTGGSIVIGIVDGTQEVVGVAADDIPIMCDKIANAVSDMITPQILPNIYVADVDGKSIVIAEVFPSPNRPYYVKSLGKEEGTFIRVGGTTRLAGAAILKDLELEGANMSYDSLAYLEADYSEKDAKKLCKVIEKYIFEETNAKRRVSLNQLKNWGLIKHVSDGIVPTNAFMLMTSNPFQFAAVQCARFKGTTRSVFIDKREFGGTLYEQIEEAYNFVLKHINLGATIEGLFRKEKYELPPDSIRELIVNAITHRNYADNACVQVSVYDDRVEVTSPGMLYGGITLKEILSGTSKIRNKVIAAVFSEMFIIEKWGTGIQRVIDGCRTYGLAAPEWIELGTTFRVNIFRPQQFTMSNIPSNDTINDTINKSEQAILELIKGNDQFSVEELEEKIDKSRSTVLRALKSLREKGIIERSGSNKSGHWVVKT